MAPGSQAAADVPAGRSGGKILKARRTATRKTPYDRPTSSQAQTPLLQPESPSWLSGLVLPAKFVAGGASKIFSSFWNPKSWSAPSSSSSDSDSESEDDSGDNENPSDGAIELNQQKDSSSQKSETLHLVEQLLMLEQFSREERDRLIEIINSRVVEGVDAGPSMIRSWTNTETPDNRSQAILEAKKWVAEKKVRSGLESDLYDGIYALKSVTTPQTTEGEAGSPVDVAKSYMRARPPWASPINQNNALSPSPLAADLFKEGTLYSSGGGISFASTKRDYLSAGSWNIQDEIRRLRSKATEDMLSSNRSLKLASFTLEHDTPKHSLASEKFKNIVERDEPITLEAPNSVAEIMNVAAEGGPPGLSDMRTAENEVPTGALPSHPTMPVLEQYQDMEGEAGDEQNMRPSDEENNLEKKKVGGESDVDKNCYLMTESTEIPRVNNSEDNNNHSLAAKADATTEKRAVLTRGSRNSSRRGKGRA